MAESDEQNLDKKPKRRLRAAPESMRELVEKSTQKANEADEKRGRKAHTDKVSKPPRKVFAPLRAVWRPIRWVLRHIVPGYFKSAFRELRLTTWPNRKQSRQLTTAVVLFAIVFGVFVSVLDYGLNKVFKELFVK